MGQVSPFTINNVYDEVVPITIGIHVCFRTRLGGNHAPLEPHQSIEAMLYFINNVFLASKHNGQFLDYNGNTMSF